MKNGNVLQMKVSNANPVVKAGQFITVVEWTSHHDNSYKGDCLEVIVADKNLLSLRERGYSNQRSFTLDLNRVIIRVLSDDLVRSVISREPVKGFGSFGELVKAKRKQSGLSLNKLSKATGMSKSYLCELENGKSGNPSAKHFATLCTHLGVDKASALELF